MAQLDPIGTGTSPENVFAIRRPKIAAIRRKTSPDIVSRDSREKIVVLHRGTRGRGRSKFGFFPLLGTSCHAGFYCGFNGCSVSYQVLGSPPSRLWIATAPFHRKRASTASVNVGARKVTTVMNENAIL